MDHRDSAPTTAATRQIVTLRIAIDHSARHRFINAAATTVWITPISTRHTCHTTPVVVIVASSIPVVIAMSITTRMWIALVITQRIPADVIAKREVE